MYNKVMLNNFELSQISSELSVKIVRDDYLTEKTRIKHYKIFFEHQNFIYSNKINDQFKKFVEKLGGIVFIEFIGNEYEISKLVQNAGFRYLCSSMGWISTSLPEFNSSPNCRLISSDLINQYKERIKEIALTFDSSHYESIDLYKPFVGEMYQNKIMSQWIDNKELIIYFSHDSPVGFTSLSVEGEEGWLLTSCVDLPYRRSNIYYEMILKGQEVLLKEKNKKCVKLECLATNIAVQKAWSKLGFKPNYATNVFCYGIKFC